MKKYFINALLLIFSLLVLAACGMNDNIQEPPDQEITIPNENTTLPQEPASDLRTPYVGAAHAVQAIVNILPLPQSDWSIEERWSVNSIEIGRNFGEFSQSHAPYTLMIVYDAAGGTRSLCGDQAIIDAIYTFEKNAEMLFDLIENLQAVTFALNAAIWSEDGTSPVYEVRWSKDRNGELSVTKPTPEGAHDWGEYSIIVRGAGLSPMYDFFTADGWLFPTHVPLYPVLTALGLSDISAGSQIAVLNYAGETVAALNIVNYLAFDDDGIIDMSAVGRYCVFMAQDFEIYAPLSLFRGMGISAYFSGGHVFIEDGGRHMR